MDRAAINKNVNQKAQEQIIWKSKKHNDWMRSRSREGDYWMGTTETNEHLGSRCEWLTEGKKQKRK